MECFSVEQCKKGSHCGHDADAKKSRSIKQWCCAKFGKAGMYGFRKTRCSAARTPFEGEAEDVDPAPTSKGAMVGALAVKGARALMATKYQLVLTRRWDGKVCLVLFLCQPRQEEGGPHA